MNRRDPRLSDLALLLVILVGVGAAPASSDSVAALRGGSSATAGPLERIEIGAETASPAAPSVAPFELDGDIEVVRAPGHSARPEPGLGSRILLRRGASDDRETTPNLV